MQVIPLIDGIFQSQIPLESTNVYCDGTNYYCYFDGEEIPPEHTPTYGEPVTEPDWLTFRLTILQDAAYQTLTLAAHPLPVTRFETAVMTSPPYLPFFPLLWAGILQTSAIESHPTTSDYQEWSALAESCHVGFTWSDTGVIELG